MLPKGKTECRGDFKVLRACLINISNGRSHGWKQMCMDKAGIKTHKILRAGYVLRRMCFIHEWCISVIRKLIRTICSIALVSFPENLSFEQILNFFCEIFPSLCKCVGKGHVTLLCRFQVCIRNGRVLCCQRALCSAVLTLVQEGLKQRSSKPSKQNSFSVWLCQCLSNLPSRFVNKLMGEKLHLIV